jgi:hypothetical protein
MQFYMNLQLRRVFYLLYKFYIDGIMRKQASECQRVLSPLRRAYYSQEIENTPYHTCWSMPFLLFAANGAPVYRINLKILAFYLFSFPPLRTAPRTSLFAPDQNLGLHYHISLLTKRIGILLFVNGGTKFPDRNRKKVALVRNIKTEPY